MKKKVNNTIKIENSPLYGMEYLDSLILLLGIHNKEELYSFYSVKNYSIYHQGPKKRLVEAPNKRLKLIQKRFNNLLQKIEGEFKKQSQHKNVETFV